MTNLVKSLTRHHLKSLLDHQTDRENRKLHPKHFQTIQSILHLVIMTTPQLDSACLFYPSVCSCMCVSTSVCTSIACICVCVCVCVCGGVLFMCSPGWLLYKQLCQFKWQNDRNLFFVVCEADNKEQQRGKEASHTHTHTHTPVCPII